MRTSPRPLRFYQKGRETQGFDGGIQQAMMAILASPKFLYRVEAPPTNAQPGTDLSHQRLELASRLSFFLWSQGPDEELLRRGGRRQAARARRCCERRSSACWPTRARNRSSTTSRTSG